MKERAVGVLILIGVLVGCSRTAASIEQDTVATEALDKWWKEQTFSPEPLKVGTVIPGRTITMKNGHVINVKSHIQTALDAANDAEDRRFQLGRRIMVKGFSVEGKTVTVLTLYSAAQSAAGRELCHEMGGFVWANANRYFGLENIIVRDSGGQMLAMRVGLSGSVH